MHAYGVHRNIDLICPDKADIGEYGLKSSAGSLRGKGGDIRSMHKNSASKRAARRRYKRRARQENKNSCVEDS